MGAMGLPSIELKGGKSFFYAARLILHVGGLAKAGIKKLSATFKGDSYNYGIQTKIKCNKNQLPTPWNITYEGEMCCVHNGLCDPDEIDTYKKTYMKDILNRLSDITTEKKEIKEEEISFEEEEITD